MSNRIKEDHDEIAPKNLILVDMPVNKSFGGYYKVWKTLLMKIGLLFIKKED